MTTPRTRSMGKARCSSAVCAGKTGVQASNTSRLASKPGSGRYFGQWDTGGLSSLLVSMVFILSFLGWSIKFLKIDWHAMRLLTFVKVLHSCAAAGIGPTLDLVTGEPLNCSP